MALIFTDIIPMFKTDLVNETRLRDLYIIAMWEGLTYSNLSYEKKLDLLSKRFFLSNTRIRNIITLNTSENLTTPEKEPDPDPPKAKVTF
ncbi:MAG: hypothetical protein K9N22_03275 [Candidatus Marinimicrobia bacterium]|nr:hypothetical protein [Candidatus Neomarinimicrobiota bacterium]